MSVVLGSAELRGRFKNLKYELEWSQYTTLYRLGDYVQPMRYREGNVIKHTDTDTDTDTITVYLVLP